MTKVILLHTVRGGQNPDDHWYVIEKKLADTLDRNDPWKKLGDIADAAHPGVLASLLVSRVQAAEWCTQNNCTIVGEMEAGDH